MKKKPEFKKLFFIILSFILFFFICEVSAAEKKALDIVLVIDKSGSMRQSDTDKLRCEASKLFVHLCSNDDKIGVIEFGNGADESFPLAFASNENKNKICEVIDKIESNNNNTSIHLALEKSFKILKAGSSGQNARIPIIVFLTDGQIKGAGDLPKGTSVERAMTSIDATCSEMKAAGIRVMSIGLGKKYDKELLKMISDTTSGFLYESENPEFLIKAYKTIFMDISNRLMLTQQIESDEIKYKYPVSADEKDAIILVSKKVYDSEMKLVSKKQIMTNNSQLDASKFLTMPARLYELIKVVNPSKGILDINLKYPQKSKYELLFIKNLALHINLISPKGSGSEYYEGDKIPLEIQLYRLDGISIKNSNFSIKLIATPPGGQPIEIRLNRDGDFFRSEFIPETYGSYNIKFVTSLNEQGTVFENYKELNLFIKQKEILKVLRIEPVQLKYTRGSKTNVAVRILRAGFDLTDDSAKSVIVTAKTSDNGNGSEKVTLKRNAENFYIGTLPLNESGKVQIDLSAEAPLCKSDTVSFNVEVIDKPTINIESPISTKILKIKDVKIKARLNLGETSTDENIEITGEIGLYPQKTRIPVKFIQSKEDKSLYICNFVPDRDGTYAIRATTNILNSNVFSDWVMFYAYNIDNPELKVSVNKISLGATVKLSVKLLPDDSTYKNESVANIFMQKPDGTAFTIELKDDGSALSCDAKAGDGIYSTIFKDTQKLGDYKFMATVSYPKLSIPNELRSFNSKTKNLGIKYIVDVEDAEKKYNPIDFNSVYDIDVMKNGSGCDGVGNFTVSVKVPKPGIYKAKFITNQDNPDVNAFLYYKEQSNYQFTAKLNGYENKFIFSYRLTCLQDGKKVTLPITMLFIDESGREFKETFYVTGVAYIPIPVWPIVLLLIIIIIVIKRIIKLKNQVFDFNIDIKGEKGLGIDSPTNGDITDRYITNNYISNKKTFYIDVNLEDSSNLFDFSGKNKHIEICCDESEKNKWTINISGRVDCIKKYKLPEEKASLDIEPGDRVEIKDGLEIFIDKYTMKFTKITINK